MSITVKEAANSVGLSKAAIFKAIRTGKISAQKNENGEWQIEPVELFRVFAPVNSIHSNGHSDVHEGTQPIHTPSVETLQMAVTQLEMRLQEMSAAKDDVIADLRHQLATCSEEKQTLLALVTTLTNQAAPPQARRGWWARLLGTGA